MQLTSTNHPFGLIPIFGIRKKRDREWPEAVEGLADHKKYTLRVDVSERANLERKSPADMNRKT
jgi:hypothetical protein